MARRNRTSLSFADNKRSVKGNFSVVLAVIALAVSVAAVVISYKKDGNAGTVVGACGIMAFLAAVMGTVFGMGAILENKSRLVAWIGTVVSALLLAGLVVLFIGGLK